MKSRCDTCANVIKIIDGKEEFNRTGYARKGRKPCGRQFCCEDIDEKT